MIFTPRLSKLLLILAKYNGYITVNELASQINTSKRTVFRELENIDKTLSKYNLKLDKKTGLGICLCGDEDDRLKFISILNDTDEFEPSDKDNRRKRLTLEILKDREAKKLYYYSNMFKVSETTISTDIEAISPWFEKYNLKLIKKQGYGVLLEGDEKDYRKALTKFITENIDNSALVEMFKNSDRKLEIDKFMMLNDKSSIYNLIDKNILNRVITTVKSIDDNKIYSMTESSYTGLIIHLTIAVDRILKCEKISMDTHLEQKLKQDDDYIVSQKIAQSLEAEFQIKIPASEISYICIHIKGAKLQHIDRQQKNIEEIFADNCDLTDMIFKMIENYDASIADKLKLDIELIDGLIVHLRPTLIRLKYRLEISNPLLAQIKHEYPEIFENSKKAADIISQKYGYEIPEDEIGFLAMHFGAAILRLNNKKITIRKVNIAVVCASGIGISFLISSKLKNIFKEKISVTTYAKDEVDKNILKDIDILVSTFDLEYMTEKSIVINPLLLADDIDKIRQKVDFYAYIEKDYTQSNSDFLKQLENIKPIVSDITDIVNNFEILYVEQNIEFKDMVKSVSTKYGNSYDAQNLIYNDLIARENMFTQVIEEYRFVLLHSKTDGVNRPIFSAILPKNNLFSDSYFKQSQAIVVMLIPKTSNRNQIEIMGSLSSALIEDKYFLEHIKNDDTEKVKASIKSILKKYFMNYLNEIY